MADFLKSSYNITFEDIKAQTSVTATEPTTAPTAEPVPESVTEPTTSSALSPINETETSDTAASATDMLSTADFITTSEAVSDTTTDPDDPMWRCGTETE